MTEGTKLIEWTQSNETAASKPGGRRPDYKIEPSPRDGGPATCGHALEGPAQLPAKAMKPSYSRVQRKAATKRRRKACKRLDTVSQSGQNLTVSHRCEAGRITREMKEETIRDSKAISAKGKLKGVPENTQVEKEALTLPRGCLIPKQSQSTSSERSF